MIIEWIKECILRGKRESAEKMTMLLKNTKPNEMIAVQANDTSGNTA